MRRRQAIILIGGLLLATGDAAGQTAGQFVVTPTKTLPVYGTPPGSFFQGKGQQVGEARAGEHYRVLGQQTVNLAIRAEVWVHIRRVESPPLEGWVFSGLRNETQTNLAPVP